MGPTHAPLPPRSPVSGAFLCVTCALATLLALSLLPPSSSRQQTWPWAGLTAVFWALPLLIAVSRLALGRPHARLGGPLDLALGLLALGGVAATALSPLRATLAPHLLPYLGALALPYALLPLHAEPRRFARLATAFLYPLLFTTLFLWLLAWPSLGGPYPRNAEPFGHANTTGAVCALAAGWLTLLAVRAPTPGLRALHIGGAVLAAALVASSSSRGSVIALAGGTLVAAGFHLVRRGRLALFVALAFAVVAGALLSNQRLRDFATKGAWSTDANESNAQRIAMIQGGFALAAERPLLGWGPGAVPHVFPRVRAPLPGQPDNYLQLHNSAAQAAATLGYAGLAAGLLLLLAAAWRARSLAASADPARLPLLGLAAGTPVLLLFDHSFAVPAFAVLAALPLTALGGSVSPKFKVKSPHHARPLDPSSSTSRLNWRSVSAATAVAALTLLLAWPVGRDLAARAAWSAALDAAAGEEPAAYAAALRRAHALAPADPFYGDLLAAHLVTGHPFAGLDAPAPADAIPILRGVLAHHPGHESAHHNLGWLLLDSEPFAAERHFASALRLAPGRRGGYLGLALARLSQLEPTATDATATDSDPTATNFDADAATRSATRTAPDPAAHARRALAAEVLLEPAFAWSPRWRDPALAPHRAATLAAVADFLVERDLAPLFAIWLRNPGALAEPTGAYRRVRQGHGVLYGHPDGPPPVDYPVFFQFDIPDGAASALPPRSFFPAARLLEFAGLAPE